MKQMINTNMGVVFGNVLEWTELNILKNTIYAIRVMNVIDNIFKFIILPIIITLIEVDLPKWKDHSMSE